MVENGMPPTQAIYAATIASADVIDRPNSLGIIEAGKLAYITAVDESPLDDITILENVSVVVRDSVLEYRR